MKLAVAPHRHNVPRDVRVRLPLYLCDGSGRSETASAGHRTGEQLLHSTN
jgi:hypothetical protein